MKIIVYYNSMAPAGGIERVISKHLQYLCLKHEVILLTNDKKSSFYSLPESIIHKSIDVNLELNMFSRIERVFQIVRSSYLITKKLRKFITENNPDLIYVASPLTLLLTYFTNFSTKKVMVTEHSSFSAYNRVYKIIASVLYKRVGLLTVPTTLDSEFYTSRDITNEYLPNPLPFYPSQIAKLENKLALNIGRLTDDKQHILLLDLWSQSSAAENGWKLKIIGKGENLEAIVAKIKQLNLENSIIIQEPTKNIVEEYLNASIFLFTSRAEGFGLVLAEAMACGVPCVSFNCPSGPRDIINNEKDGFLIDVGNHSNYIQRLDELIENTELRRKLGNAAKKSIKKFSSELVSKKLNNLLNYHFEKK